MTDPDLRDSLSRNHQEYRLLLLQHQSFEGRLAELARRPHLNGEEEVARVNLKKHKLRLKDRMEEIARQVRVRA